LSAATTPFSSPDERRAILALSVVADIGNVKHKQLTERFGSASRALDVAFSREVAANAFVEADVMLEAAPVRGLTLVTHLDDEYPASLRDLHDPPAVLWVRGEWSTLREPIVAIVGTRRATAYGLRITREIATALARAGASIVSGMALGIDAAAHVATLEANGRTIAILGTGADVSYPRAHVALHRAIGTRGLVLSELAPGARSDAGSFPRRNRIIAALATLTIVVEAPIKSGALLTSGCALELGRDVAAVPGPIDSPQSVGSNELIRDGAHAITSPADAVRLVGLEVLPKLRPQMDDDTELRVWNALERSATSLDELCTRAALPVAQCMSAVTGLELRGIVECALTGEVRRR
jgi:DNA processing protein